MKNDLITDVEKGDPITADGYNEVLETIRQFQGLKGSMVVGGKLITRPTDADGVPILYKLINCDDEEDTKIVSNDLSDKVGKVVMVDGVCYQVEDDDDDDKCKTGECVNVQNEFDDCKECKTGAGSNCCWRLTPCSTGSVFTIKDCSFSRYEGKTVKWNDGNCYTVAAATSCTGFVEGDSSNVEDDYDDCTECESCVKLRSCCDASEIHVASSKLSTFQRFVGQVVKYNGTCYEVMEIDLVCPGGEIGGSSDGATYDDCGNCGCYVLQACSNGGGTGEKVTCKATYLVGGAEFNLSSLAFGDVVTLGNASFPECFELIDPATPPDCQTAQDIQIQEEYDGCSCCVGYKITRCSPNSNEIIYSVNPDLCQYMENGSLISGTVLKRADVDGFCFDQMVEVPIDGGHPWEEFLVDIVSSSCPQCQDPVYSLTDAGCKEAACGSCSDGNTEDPLYTDEDLSKVVDKIIKYDGTCWLVDEAPGEVVDLDAPITWSGPFEECEPCVQEPACIEVVVDIDWENKKVKKKKYAIIAVKCGESEDTIPTAPCP